MMASGRRPMTRAACTYSLFFSTSVEPRTVRAYCTQPDMPIARTSTGIAMSSCGLGRQRDARHAVDQQRDQDRREGELHVGDAHDEGVEPAAEVARDQPEGHAEHQREQHRGEADASEMRAPYRIADSMSRPWLSVPSG